MNYEKKVIAKLKALTGCKYVALTNRGNTSIMAVLYALKQMYEDNPQIAIQDQGGWITYEQFSKKLKLPVWKVKTNHGIIERLSPTEILLLEEPAGYFVQQTNIQMIRKNAKFLILDVTGSLGKTYIKTFKADIYLGGFGKDKPVNLGYGGFIATNKKKILDLAKPKLKAFEKKELFEELYYKLISLKERYKKFKEIKKHLMQELKDFEILYPDSDAVNLAIKARDDMELIVLKQYCNLNKIPYTECPRYIRFKDYGISIEIKRM